MFATDTVRGITVLLPYGFDGGLGTIDHPKTTEVDFFIANPTVLLEYLYLAFATRSWLFLKLLFIFYMIYLLFL